MTKKVYDESELLAEAFSDILSKDKPAKKQSGYKLKRSFKLVILVTFLFVIIGVAGVLVFVLSRPSPTESQLNVYKEAVNFQLYTPNKLPSGYQPDKEKTTNAGGAIFITFKNSDSTQPIIVMSQQAIPDGISIQNLLGVTPPEPIDTPSGKLYMASTEEINTAILVTDKSWVILTASKSLDQNALKDLASNLKPISE